MRFMYDSVHPEKIRPDVELVAGYINGPYRWTSAEWARFPDSIRVEISVRSNEYIGTVLDVEPGAVWPPSEAVDWVIARRAAGIIPTVYCGYSNWAMVKAAFNARRVNQPLWWVAKWDGDGTTIPHGAIAKQYVNIEPLYDINVAEDYWPGIDQPPNTAPKEDHMYTFELKPGTNTRDCVPIPVDRSVAVTLVTNGEATVKALGWIAPAGGNGYSQTFAVEDKGAETIRPPRGTAKIDFQYTANNVIRGVVDIIG